MDAKRTALEEKLADSLEHTAAIAAELQALDQAGEIPHFDLIEGGAHDVGQRLSRIIQTARGREVAAEGLGQAACPDCGQTCSTETYQREVRSVDGPIEITEIVAHCRRCRRSFFPSA